MAIAKVQIGTLGSGVGSAALTLPAVSTVHNLIVACVRTDSTANTIGAPSGWAKVVGQDATSWGTQLDHLETWYLKDCPGSISSYTFTITGSANIEGSVSEWSGADTVNPLDQFNNGTAAAGLTATASLTGAASGVLAITNWAQEFAGNSFTPGGGWANLSGDQTGFLAGDWTSDYILNQGPGSVSELETSNGSDAWVWIIATFAPPGSGGGATALPPVKALSGLAYQRVRTLYFQSLYRPPFVVQASGPVQYMQSLIATLNFTGPTNLTNSITKALTAAVLNLAGALTKATTKGLAAATLTFTGPVNLVKQTGHKMAGALNFTGPTNLVKNIVKLMTGQLSFTGPTHLLNAITKNLAAAVLSFTGALTKFTTKTTFSATLSFTGALTAGKQFLRALTATLTFTGPTNLVKNINKNVSGTLTFTGPTHLLNSINKSMAAGLTFTGSLLRAITKNLTSATLTFAGTVVKSTRKTLVGAVLAFTGTFTKQTNKALSAVLSFTGSAHLLNSTGKNVSGVLSFTGKQSRAMTKNLTAATLTFTGALTKTTSKLLAGALSFVGAVVSGSGAHQFTQVLSAALNFSGAFVKQTDKTLVASLAFAGHSLVNNITKGMTAVLSFTGRLSKATTKTTFTATLTFTGRFVKQAQKPFTGVLSFTGPTALKKTFIKTFAAALNFVGGLLQPVPPQPAKQKNLLETVQANIDLATTETYPYQIDLTNYLSTGDSIGGYYITMIQIPEGNAVAPPWRGNVTFNGNIMIIPLLGSAFQLGQKYQMNVTFVANTNKVVTFLTYIHIVN